MAKAKGPSTVHCYHCGHPISVSGMTMSTSCPGCHKAVLVEDIIVDRHSARSSVETCGQVIVGPKGELVAQKRIIAYQGIVVEGRIRAPQIVTSGQAVIGEKAEWTGDLRAASLIVKAGAKIAPSFFVVPDPTLPRSQG